MMKSMVIQAAKPSAREALQEIQELLRAVSEGRSPNRIQAVRYTLCREVLMDGETRRALPGYMVQCVSIFKFYDFITLYHPQIDVRLAFVNDTFRTCRAMLDAERVFDVFESELPSPSRARM